MSKLAHQIAGARKWESNPMGFGAIARKLSPTMLLLARLPASEAKRLTQAAQQGLDAVLFDAGSFSDLKDEPKNAGELPVGAMLSSVRGDDAKAFAEAGIDFLAFDSASTPADLLLDEKLGFVLALTGEPSDSELRVLEGLPLDALLAPPLSTTLTVSTQLGLRRLAFFSQRPLLLEVPPDIPSSQLQSLREAGVIGVLVDGKSAWGKLPEIRARIDGLPVRRPRRSERPDAILPRAPVAAAPAADDDDEE